MIIFALAAASLVAAFAVDTRAAEGKIVLSKIQTDALYMIMILSIILLCVACPIIYAG